MPPRPPEPQPKPKPKPTSYPFELDEAFGRIVYKLPSGLDGSRATLKSATELEYEAELSNYGGGKGTHRILLHKRTEAPADR